MKRTYITPSVKKVINGVICNAVDGSRGGILPQQETPNASGEPYSDNPYTNQVMSNQRGGFGSDSGPWESLW